MPIHVRPACYATHRAGMPIHVRPACCLIPRANVRPAFFWLARIL